MPAITDDILAPAKILLIGKSGAGKTGSLASLVAAGYNLRIIDTDKGIRPLRSLVMDPHYPYAKIIKDRGIDLNHAVRYVPIDTSMKLRNVTRKLPGENRSSSETLLAPADAKAWTKVLDLLDAWKEEEVDADGHKKVLDFGSVRTWTTKEILVLDSFSTLAKCAYYFSQSLNGRLGARDEGFDYQRDIGSAQAQLTRLLELLYDSSVACNVIVISHITWVDESQGVASRPRETKEGNIVLSNPDGYPSAIGRALSPQMGKYFNDAYVARSTGTGAAVQRTISTVPTDGVLAKNSVYLEREYPVTYAMAAIFAALRAEPPPADLMEACAPRRAAPPAPGQKIPAPASV
jgi:hypothetical protein